MFKEILQNVREDLRKHGWRLILYPRLGLLKSQNSLGLCDESEKKLQVATKGLSKEKILWFLAHEYSHFNQALTLHGKPRRKLDLAYVAYSEMTDSNRRIKAEKLSSVRKLVIEYEYEADRMAYEFLTQWGVGTRGFKADANSYNYVIRYAFVSGYLINKGRDKLAEKLGIEDRWLCRKERNSPLDALETKIIDEHVKKIRH